MINIYEDSRLRIPNLSADWINGLSRITSITNEQKERAQRELVRGAKYMDDLLTLAELDDKELILPRGIKVELCNLLDKHGHDYQIIDNTSFNEKKIDIPKAPILKKDQAEAVRQIVKNVQGRIIMPTGSGKTVVALSAIEKIRKPTIILVDKLHIAKQWQDRSWEHIGYTPGLIGDKEWHERDITIALLQTLRSRRENINDSWWEKWNIVIFDEQHHIPAETYQDLVQRFPAKYRLGLSATIGKSAAKKRISELIFGEIIYELKQQKIKPTIQVIETGFDFEYRPTQKIGNKVIRNNYHDLISSLIEDHSRNDLIANKIFENKSRANLVVSRRLNQLKTIKEKTIAMGFPEERCWMLTGEEDKERRMEVYDLAVDGECVIFSTVADEAVDIPRLDRLHLIYPQKNIETIKQQIGRLTREHPDKTDCMVFDYVDSVGIIENQFGHRLRNLYQREQLKVYKIQNQSQ